MNFDHTQQIKKKMKEMNFSPKKFLGQNFLVNPVVIDEIISTVRSLNPTLIVEIGPGLGALTDPLILLQKPLFLIEQDLALCEYWKKKKIRVLEGDVLKMMWTSVLVKDCVLVGNLSYQIASRLMVKCCSDLNDVKSMVFMFQKEVAQRIVSPPFSKNYGILSVLSQCFWEIYFITEASTSDFYPRPTVAGQVLLFKKKKCSIQNPIAFLHFIKFCFAQRRKMLLSRLKKTNENMVSIFSEMHLSSSCRAEELSPEQFVSLFNLMESKRGS